MFAELNHVADIFASFPSIGRKSAMRIVFYLLKKPSEQIAYFSDTLKNLHEKIEFCLHCGAVKSKKENCQYCDSHKRDPSALCVVEEPSDIFSVENSGEYKGIYHVLMGVLSPINGIGPKDIRIKELKKRIEDETSIEEIIVATNPTLEGNTTAHYIAKLASSLRDIKITRIASGLASGTSLDYADSQVISQSIRDRMPIKL